MQTRERARGTSTWMWLAAAVFVVVALMLWRRERHHTTPRALGGEVVPVESADAAQRGGTAATVRVVDPVEDFVEWADQTSNADAILSHEYVSAGIVRLAGAIGALTARDSLAGSPVLSQMVALDRLANQVRRDPDALTHAEAVRAAFTSSAALLGELQTRRFPAAADAVADVRAAARSLGADRPLTDQRAEVERFFARAATALRVMRTSV